MGRRGNDTILLTAAALGAISGLRSLAAPALLGAHLAAVSDADEFGPLERLFTSDATATVLKLLAVGEMLADKAPFMPDRTTPLPLIGRAVLGSMTAAAFAVHRRRSVLLPAAVGAGAAIASTFAAYHLRHLAQEQLRVPDGFLGMVEDAIVVGASRLVVESME